ncbi:MAG: cold-shock protein [Gammaproteobacteria bacterium]|nr:cold-shock protein [Gammaproteobacteria bacterium]|tara:strand:- start:6 stop:398 length:393 start_codon:yes stop_codon:yes gene_type:complete
MIIIKKICFAILITAFIFSLIKFSSEQISLPGHLEDVGLFLIIFVGPLASLLLQEKLFSIHEEAFEFGNIKWFNSRKGYGFINADQGDEIFVHFRNFTGKETNNIREGQRVKFVTVSSEKGLQADKVSFV